MELLTDSSIWLLASFLIFAFLVFKYGKGVFLKILDDRIAQVREEIETAETLRVEAQELLAQYQRKHRDAVKEAELIITNAERHASEIRTMAQAELKETMQRREKQLKERLARMEASAIEEIQAYAANLAIDATAEIIAGKLDKKTNETLVEKSIKDIGQNIH